MGDDILTNLISKQRRRLVATFLGWAEREVYPDLSPDQQEDLRSKFLESVGVFSDFALDCVRSTNEGSVLNEEAMRVLYAINNGVKALAEDFDEEAP